jgi:hypothetical protein
MKFKLETKIPTFNEKINYGDALIFYGSCFSDEISKQFKNAGFDVYSNPFGTIFHPIVLAKNIQNSLNNKINEESIFSDKNYFFSWNSSSIIGGKSKQELQNNIEEIQSEFKEKIKNSTYFFITFGTSFGYYLKENDEIVANCHKQNSTLFEKKLSPIEEQFLVWKDTIQAILKINPQVKLVFTISPVRHSKDGLTENNRSKARLFELISRLEEEFPILYFPSYEIVIDELRDYRFFEKDLVHPNQLAIDYIWEIIKSTFFDNETLKICEEGEKLRRLEDHKIMTQFFEDKKTFDELKRKKISRFLLENQKFNW